MADTVQVMMEKMIPELEDLQEKKLFTKDEIHQIVERRRDFEYMMKRSPLRKIDALRYIEYELNLDALRQKRKERSGLQKASLSDTAGIKRVHSIFDRVIYKHRGSIDLWLQYIAFCKTEGSSRVLSHVFSRALQVHPRSAEIWVEAASFEFSANLNIESARVLMQRAIRINKSCQRLWHEYFRLELLYIQKLTVRREILKLDADSAKDKNIDTGASVLIDELPEETTKDGENDAEFAEANEKHQARQVILQGAIPRIIYSNAIAAIADDIAFRLRFIEISDLFVVHHAFASELSQFILDACLRDFPSSELVHKVKALRPFAALDESATDAVSVAHAETLAIQSFEQSIVQLDSVVMQEQFANWIVERLAVKAAHDRSTTQGLSVEYAAKKLKQSASDSSALAIKYVDFVHRTEGTLAAIDAAKLLLSKHHAREAPLWLLYAQLVLHQPTISGDNKNATQDVPSVKRRRTSTDNKIAGNTGNGSKHNPNPVAEAIAILEDTAASELAQDDYDGKLEVVTRLLELLIGNATTNTQEIHQTFQNAMAAQVLNSSQWSTLRQQFVAWAASVYSVERVRSLYKTFLEGQLLPTDATYAFLLLCVDVETSVVAQDVHVAQVRLLFEKLVDVFGKTHEDAWIAYIRFFTDHALYADAVKVHQRAVRAWKDSPRLAQISLTGGSL